MSKETEKPNIARLPHPGEVIDGRYRLEETFASGGMGVIMRAEQLRTGRDVAVKLLHPHIASRPDFAARFMREVKVATLFDHPHIVRCYDVGETDRGGLYLVMELLEGEELKDIIERDAPLSTGRVMRLGLQMLDGLGEAHSQEVIHRDFKPANVFVTTTRRGEEAVKLLDFGIAKLVNAGDMQVTATGSFTGTPSYMPPETMFDVKDVNKMAGDVYAAGLVLLEMLTGQRVFDGKVLAQTVLQHLKKPVLIPEAIANTALGEILKKATSKHPDDRYADGDEMFLALKEARDRTPEDIRLSTREVPGPAPETSPSLLEKLGQQSPEKSLAMLRDVPQAESVGPQKRRCSEVELPRSTDTPTGNPTTEEARSPSSSDASDADSTMELSTDHIDVVTVDGEDKHDAVSDFDVGPTEICAPESMPHPVDVDPAPPEADETDEAIALDSDFGQEPTRVETPRQDEVDPNFDFEPTRVERPSHLPGDDHTPDAPQVGPDDETLQTVVDADVLDEAATSETPPPEPRTPQPDAPAEEATPPVDAPPAEDTSRPIKLIGLIAGLAAGGVIIAAIAIVVVGGDDEPDDDDSGDDALLVAESPQPEEHDEEVDDDDAAGDAMIAEVEDEADDDEELLHVEIASEPSGAAVYADDEKLGTTRLSADFNPPERPDRFRLEKDGYEDETVEWTDEQSELLVTLEKIAEPEPAASSSPPAPSPDSAPPPAIEVQEEQEEQEDDTRDIDSVIDEHLFQ